MEFKFNDPAADFSDGIAVLKTYHADLLERGQFLLALAETLERQGMHEDLANRCIALHCHYHYANRLHHLDEERGLFPLLLDKPRIIDAMIERLMVDHEEIEQAWDALSVMLGAPAGIGDVKAFKQTAAEFEKIQREHLIRENEDFLPVVESLLTPEQKRESGAAMANLRRPRA